MNEHKAELIMRNIQLSNSLDRMEKSHDSMVESTLKLITRAISTHNPSHTSMALYSAFALIANMSAQQKEMMELLRKSALDMSIVLSDIIDKEDDEDE